VTFLTKVVPLFILTSKNMFILLSLQCAAHRQGQLEEGPMKENGCASLL
jgi:hypothetical protein